LEKIDYDPAALSVLLPLCKGSFADVVADLVVDCDVDRR
jgi:hypothetical protein